MSRGVQGELISAANHTNEVPSCAFCPEPATTLLVGPHKLENVCRPCKVRINPTYEELAGEIGKLTHDKELAYGKAWKSSAEILRILFPNGCAPERFTDLLLVTRILDKLCRLAAHPTDPMQESPYRDIVGYGLIGLKKEKG